jgi:N6-L-threonylcarbamoyladenine synthase
MIRSKNLDFSFSGLKTSVINMFKEKVSRNEDLPLADIAASFQEAIVDVLVTKTMRAVAEKSVRAVSVTGGVSANSRLREAFEEKCKQEGIDIFFPKLSLCTDNAAMIAAAGYARIMTGEVSDLRLDVVPNAPLEVYGDNED